MKIMTLAYLVQTFCSVIGIILAVSIRPKRLFVIIHTILALLGILGWYGFTKNMKYALFIHGIISSVLGISLFFYQTLDRVIIEGKYLEIFMFLIFLVDGVVGCMSLWFINKINRENEEISEVPDENVIGSVEFNNLNENLISSVKCCICRDRTSNIMIYQCGHKCVCIECSHSLIKNIHKCPICRNLIKDLVRVYD